MEYKFRRPCAENFLRPLVIGAGPCGLFAALLLAQMGFKPIILETRQSGARTHQGHLGAMAQKHSQPESNVQFGEGGAGTFRRQALQPDQDPRHLGRKVLTEFVKAGAPKKFSPEAHPHIGTFRLVTNGGSDARDHRKPGRGISLPKQSHRSLDPRPPPDGLRLESGRRSPPTMW